MFTCVTSRNNSVYFQDRCHVRNFFDPCRRAPLNKQEVQHASLASPLYLQSFPSFCRHRGAGGVHGRERGQCGPGRGADALQRRRVLFEEGVEEGVEAGVEAGIEAAIKAATEAAIKAATEAGIEAAIKAATEAATEAGIEAGIFSCPCIHPLPIPAFIPRLSNHQSPFTINQPPSKNGAEQCWIQEDRRAGRP